MTLDEISVAFKALSEAFKPVADAIGLFIANMKSLTDTEVRRYAIEKLGVTEVDIKRTEGMRTVVLWNRRRLDIDAREILAWAEGKS